MYSGRTHRIDRYISLSRWVVELYDEMILSKDPSVFYRAYVGEGICPICEQVDKYTRSCSSCSTFVFSGKICTEQKTKKALESIISKEVGKERARVLLIERRDFHRKLIECFEQLKEEL